ncbi:TIM barrel protein [Paenibacillus sp. PvP091]|uniref:TIM barrel protein n=1 Tax=unclassified Paenibacillus TaxID=185978 RepID=UPI001B3E12BE|nr:xylose isomerase [Paenibacillus sp. PvP091]MBP1171722.1 xylose isomerase [Paenibacillus sp. PvR098]MBP2438103.1 xylose isomerase [Paenibacillus sp. PvP052]
MKVPMVTVSLFADPIFKDGAFTSNDPRVRAYAIQKTMESMDLGAELGAEVFVLWGGPEGSEVDAGKNAVEAMKRYREALNYLCEYVCRKSMATSLLWKPSRTNRAQTFTFRRQAPCSA